MVPETFAFVAPSRLDLFRDHPEAGALAAARARCGIAPPDELWLLTTGGETARRTIAAVREWWALVGAPLPLRAWMAADVDQLAGQAECEAMTELTLRVALRAAERAAGGQLLMSLAGGRKTMSSDLHAASQAFGCTALLHVVGSEPLPAELKSAGAEIMTRPLPADLVRHVTPVVVGRSAPSEVIGAVGDTGTPIRADCFPIPDAPDLGRTGESPAEWRTPRPGCSLGAAIEKRQREALVVLGNYFDRLRRDEHHENWRSLYRLPPARIEHLRKIVLDERHAGWIRRLPRAELHCHLGGVLGIAGQIEVGRAVWAALPERKRLRAVEDVRPLLDDAARGDAWPDTWPEMLQNGPDRQQGVEPERRSERVAALLVNLGAEAVERQLFAPAGARIALKYRSPLGFAAYERPGELMGSAILQHEAAIPEYARQVVLAAEAQGLRYLELRASPDKYLLADCSGENAARFVELFRSAVEQAARGKACMVRLLWTLERRWPLAQLTAAVERAVRLARGSGDFILAFDLAGDETHAGAAALAPAFESAFEACLPLTVHAGETTGAEAIWQAAYLLHADRIGHGLRLPEDEELARRLRNRRVCVELCPTSNREVQGFADPAVAGTEDLPRYPLRELLDRGLPVAICTDNPGISRTDSAAELVVASRMSGGLSLWETLALTRLAFVHAFLPATEREELLKEADRQVLAQLAVSEP